jgi:hypothetical protein
LRWYVSMEIFRDMRKPSRRPRCAPKSRWRHSARCQGPRSVILNLWTCYRVCGDIIHAMLSRRCVERYIERYRGAISMMFP